MTHVILFLVSIVFGLSMADRAEKGGAKWPVSMLAGIGGVAVVALVAKMVGLS